MKMKVLKILNDLGMYDSHFKIKTNFTKSLLKQITNDGFFSFICFTSFDYVKRHAGNAYVIFFIPKF